jgi:hypothetical protein
MTATVSARFEGSILPRSGLSLFARWQKKRRRIQYPGRLSTAGSGLDAQNVAPEMAPNGFVTLQTSFPIRFLRFSGLLRRTV